MGVIKRILRPLKPVIYTVLRNGKGLLHLVIRRAVSFVLIFSLVITEKAPSSRSAVLGNRRLLSFNGMKTGFTRFSLYSYALFKLPEIHLCVVGTVSSENSIWIRNFVKKTRSKVSFFPDINTSWSDLRIAHLQNKYQRVMILADGAGSMPGLWQIVELLQALNSYDDRRRIGVVHPAVETSEGIITGNAFDRSTSNWVALNHGEDVFGQSLIPRYVLSAPAHLSVISHKFVESVLPPNDSEVEPVLVLFSSLIREGWQKSLRCLAFPQVVVSGNNFVPENASEADLSWLLHRRVTDPHGRIKIIFVLPATTLSGGIRVVFEKALGLQARGFTTEIWSLNSTNAWGDIGIDVKRFPNYDLMGTALAQESAIKVATWWETADVVFLGSIERGIPTQFVQEFETWFYPESREHRAGVVASYRPEFEYITTAEYQQDELQVIGIEAHLVPVGFDDSIYRPIDNVTRESDAIVAIGRSFFQKNFALTLSAWKEIPEEKPKLIVFSSEALPLKHPKLEFISRPSNNQVNEIYNRGSLFIQTSRHEGFCLPIIEAMAAGCVVITTDSHGNRGFCKDGYNCVVVEQDDVMSLRDTISRVLADTSLQDTLRNNAFETAKHFAWPAVLDKYADVYREIAAVHEK